MTSAPLYRAPWFLALASLSRGTGWTAHEAGRSYLRESGEARLPRAVLPLVLASLPPAAHKLAIGALKTIGLWVETPEGFELREAPEAPAVAVAAGEREAQRREAQRAATRARVAKHRAKKGGVTSPVTDAPTPPVTSVGNGVTEGVTSVTEGVTSPVFSSSPSGENSSSESLKSEQAGGAGGASDAAVTGEVTQPVTPPTVTHTDPTFGNEPGTGPLSAPPAPPSTPRPVPTAAPAPEAPAPPKPRRRAPRPEMAPDVAEIFAYWRETLSPGAEPLRQRIDAVEARLRGGRSVADIKLAIDGCAKSEFHRSKGYIDLELICRAGKFDRFLAWGRGTADPNAAPPSTSRRAPKAAPPQSADPGPVVLRWGKENLLDYSNDDGTDDGPEKDAAE